MAPVFDLRDYLGPGVGAGSEFGVEVKFLAWINAGTGEIMMANEHAIGLKVRASLFGREKQGKVQLVLEPPQIGEDGTVGGACSLCVGRQIDGEARYRVEGEDMIVSGHVYEQDVLLRARHDGRHCIVEMKKPRSIKLRLTFDED